MGMSSYGQLGIADDTLSHTPVKLNGLPETPIQLSIGNNRGCVTTTSKIYCCGNNQDNVIDPTNINDQLVPKVVYIRSN